MSNIKSRQLLNAFSSRWENVGTKRPEAFTRYQASVLRPGIDMALSRMRERTSLPDFVRVGASGHHSGVLLYHYFKSALVSCRRIIDGIATPAISGCLQGSVCKTGFEPQLKRT